MAYARGAAILRALASQEGSTVLRSTSTLVSRSLATATAAKANVAAAAKPVATKPPGAIAVEGVKKGPKAVVDEKCGTLPAEDDDMEDMVEMVDPKTGEWGGPTKGGSRPEPTRFGDWERKGRCTDFV